MATVAILATIALAVVAQGHAHSDAACDADAAQPTMGVSLIQATRRMSSVAAREDIDSLVTETSDEKAEKQVIAAKAAEEKAKAAEDKAQAQLAAAKVAEEKAKAQVEAAVAAEEKVKAEDKAKAQLAAAKAAEEKAKAQVAAAEAAEEKAKAADEKDGAKAKAAEDKEDAKAKANAEASPATPVPAQGNAPPAAPGRTAGLAPQLAAAEVSSSEHTKGDAKPVATPDADQKPGLLGKAAEAATAGEKESDKKKWLFGGGGGGLGGILGGATKALKGVIGDALPDDMPGGDIVKGLVNTGLDVAGAAGTKALEEHLPPEAKEAVQQAAGVAQMAAGMVQGGLGKKMKSASVRAFHKLAEDTNFMDQFASILAVEEAKQEDDEAQTPAAK